MQEYIVICLDGTEGRRYVLATQRFFARIEEAEDYMAGINRLLRPRVCAVPVRRES